MFNFNTSKRRGEPEPAPAAVNTAEEQEADGAVQADTGEEMDPKNIEIEAQRLAFMKKHPDFDILSEMKNNKQFIEYVWYKGLSVEDAYFLTHRDEVIRSEVDRELERIAARRDRIAENGAGKSSPAVVKLNPKELSDKEIDSIIRRARSGEKISF